MITVNLYETTDGSWAYSVNINNKVYKIGTGHDYNSAARMAKSGVKSAQRLRRFTEQTQVK